MRRFQCFLLVAISFPILSSLGTAQTADLEWLTDLKLELRIEKECEVDFFLNLRDWKTNLGDNYSARIQCKDGRRFDATKIAPDQTFTIETCARQVCGVEIPKKKDS